MWLFDIFIGDVTLTATVTDGEGVTVVDFYEGAAMIGSDGSHPYELVMSFTETDNGIHYFSAVATDGSDNSSESDTLDIITSMGRGPQGSDRSPFTVDFIATQFSHTIIFYAEWDCDDSCYDVDNLVLGLSGSR